ncbi:MAG: N-6 DNA methylase [Proteobacteria bacterium]|nr:N-6 DNA methylase [Pseudomonadota bacterium]
MEKIVETLTIVESFLAEYDPVLRKVRGVYYTPEPVVSYIVRSIDHILKSDFDLADGLADISTVRVPAADGEMEVETPKVIILDPAVGTGTFLYTVIDHIHDHELAKGQGGAWSGYVSRYLLPRLFGFELLMAPYAVCHMKLGLQLADTGYDFKANERLRVYLTNTLEEAHEVHDLPLFAQALAREAHEAGQVKQDRPVMVILGNPPYAGHSANKGKWIKGLLRGKDLLTNQKTANYFEVDGKPLGETQVKWLHDDYVKFFRFAQWRIERTGYGILAFISNHGYLDNPTFRGMRQSLADTFDDIYILDLHGNVKKKELSPDGSKDENVFDIQQGVCIGVFVKRRGEKKKPATVRHAHVWGARETYESKDHEKKSLSGGKYYWLNENVVATTTWTDIDCRSPYFLYIPQSRDLREEYDNGWTIKEIMPANSVAIVTARDHLSVHIDEDKLWQTVSDFATLPVETAREKYKLGKDARDWKVELAQNDLKSSGPSKSHICKILYRPFDFRYTYYTGQSRGFIGQPQRQMMECMRLGSNLGLSTVRKIDIVRGWEHAFCTSEMIQHHSVSNKEVNYLFPLYIISKNKHSDLFNGSKSDGMLCRNPNLALKVIKVLSVRLGMEFVSDGMGDRDQNFGPEDVFDYVYALLYAPAYRKRYADFLKFGFPRVSFTSNRELFRQLCDLGRELVGLHLMQRCGPAMTRYEVHGSNVVEMVAYTAPEGKTPGRVWINKEQYFEGVPPEVWAFQVGGYQICDKWLKDRKGRELGYDDIQHYQRIVSALSETIRLMGEIDAAIDSHGGWPLQ